MKTFCKVIGWLLLVLLLVGAIAVLWRYANVTDEALASFFIEVDGEHVSDREIERDFEPGRKVRVETKYLSDGAEDGPRGYGLKILTVAAEDFRFTAGGVAMSWRDEDLTPAFAVEKGETGFTLAIPDAFSSADLLRKKYAGNEIVSDRVNDADLHFRMIVSNADGSVSYEIRFRVLCGSKIEVKTEGNVPEDEGLLPVLPARAVPGFLVEFGYAYAPAEIHLEYGKTSELLTCDMRFVYSFEMPDCDVTVRFVFA